MKKILIVSQYFDPETFKVNDIAYYLSSKGYEVHVIAGIPNYPKGRYFDGYGLFSKTICRYASGCSFDSILFGCISSVTI